MGTKNQDHRILGVFLWVPLVRETINSGGKELQGCKPC